ncbi:Centrosomal protein of 19 kDa [Schistosoma japonicum]|uniref:Centrosomal protein of 19 kDa n=1 Tax=Schistosoma japonicum TaxID=6182 RepID=A0A4Z2CY56_SCHJA|nr:Centrosomal protein of 19 kDa [Schistosoma japonicum]KAH8859530.1 Centrosomal protein of 19 kDa [Schistosoma japonicum]TNN09174.1 Centrosomal protein of 19 kDa [Schistosoma japonicum]TNN09175.1 Centrosomal protein of 19 kDa [Schistosoma japonicum]
MCSAVLIKRCGISVDSKCLAIIYGKDLKTRLRKVSLPMLQNSTVAETFKELQLSERHKQFISLIPEKQILRLLTILKDVLNGMNLSDSLNRKEFVDSVQSDEDLNRTIPQLPRDYNVSKREQAIMNKLLKDNPVYFTGQNFIYDKEPDFQEEQIETYSWDSDECEF